MKHIKLYEEGNFAPIIGRPWRILGNEGEEITSPEQLEEILKELSVNFDSDRLYGLLDRNPFIREKEPYKKLYLDYLRRRNK